MAIEFETLKIPYKRPIGVGLRPGSSMTLEGFIPQQSKGFDVNFAYGQYRGANVALRFKPYFEGPSSSPAVVSLNTFKDRQWGKEEKRNSPFQRGQPFKIQFITTPEAYEIIQNDKVQLDYPHHLPPGKVRFLEMDGDVTLQKVVFSWERGGENYFPLE